MRKTSLANALPATRLKPVFYGRRHYGHGTQLTARRLIAKRDANAATYAHLPKTPCSARSVVEAMVEHMAAQAASTETFNPAATDKPKRIRKPKAVF